MADQEKPATLVFEVGDDLYEMDVTAAEEKQLQAALRRDDSPDEA